MRTHIVWFHQPRLAPAADLDFDFIPGGFVHNGYCLLTAQLPDYPIAEVRTGQWNEDGAIWSARFTPAIESMDR